MRKVWPCDKRRHFIQLQKPGNFWHLNYISNRHFNLQKFPEEPELAVPPYYFERIAKCALQAGNYILKENRREYDYHQMSWKYYELYLKYATHWKVPYHDSKAHKSVKTLLRQFDETLAPVIKEQKRKNVWKKETS